MKNICYFALNINIEMKYYTIISFFFILIFIVSCTSYNSDDTNKRLIQGTWALIDVEHSRYDSVHIDYSKEQTYLIFKGDSCREYMIDLEDTVDLAFLIRDYHLAFTRNDTIISRFSIDSLTNRTLVLSFDKNRRIYKKEAILQ